MSDFPPPPPGATPPPPPPPPPGGGYGGLEPVGPGMRLLAKIIDGLVLAVPVIAIAAIVGDGLGASGGRAFLANIFTTLLGFGYYTYLEMTKGQTVGKMALSLKVIGPDGGVPTSEQAARRNAYVLLGIIPTALGALVSLGVAVAIAVTISNDPFKRGWHDNFAGGTAVVRSK